MDPKQLVRVGYDKVAHAYRADADSADAHDYTAWVDRLCNDLEPRPHILDLGCGCGIPVAQMLAVRGEVTGVDISPVQVDRARALLPGCRFVCADMCRVVLPVGSFDAAVALYSIIHVPLEEQEALFRRIADWLKPGGYFLGTLGSAAWTGTEQDWLGVTGATMYWSHADAQTYRRWLEEAGLEILHDEFVPERDGGHQLFYAKRIG